MANKLHRQQYKLPGEKAMQTNQEEDAEQQDVQEKDRRDPRKNREEYDKDFTIGHGGSKICSKCGEVVAKMFIHDCKK
jgi:hypothetical protein